MKFELLGGGHVDENLKQYKKGDTITSSLNLDKLFKNKFRLLTERHVDKPTKKKSKKEPEIPTSPDTVEIETDAENTVSGEV